MVTIGTAKKPNGTQWHRIRAEYIGGISQTKLAKKYHISRDTIAKKCRLEQWTDARNAAKAEIAQKILQKTADAAADNATLAAGIKRKLLQRLDRILDTFPEDDATEVQKYDRQQRKVYKLKDLTAMYKDLTGDIAQQDGEGSELLKSLVELERRVSDG